MRDDGVAIHTGDDGMSELALDDFMDAFDAAMRILEPKSAIDWDPLPHFRVPPTIPKWLLWLLFGGRGSGKTAHAAKYVHDHVHGPPCIPGVPGGHWISIVAPTLGDAVTSCVEGPSGLRLHDPGVRVLTRPGGIIARWSNGCEAKLFGANSPNDVERFRAGGNRCLVWAEEMAAWRYLDESWQQIRYGLRSGPRPHAIASTTPRTRKLIRELVADENVVVSHGKMTDNPYLNDDVKEQLWKDYGGTRMGRQELDGELLEDVENALWNDDLINRTRVQAPDQPNHYDRKVVAIDPAATENGDEHGIIVGGMVKHWDDAQWRPEIPHWDWPHGFILADYSLRGLPHVWARKAIEAYHDHDCDLIVGEVNNGGDMIKATIHGIDPTIPFKAVHASRGKAKRAEPIANLFDQGRCHVVDTLPKLEDQMVTWDHIEPDESWSPDRMDAMVWCMTELLVAPGFSRVSQYQDDRLKGRR
jgi:phage terminase large subunit-like protein